MTGATAGNGMDAARHLAGRPAVPKHRPGRGAGEYEATLSTISSTACWRDSPARRGRQRTAPRGSSDRAGSCVATRRKAPRRVPCCCPRSATASLMLRSQAKDCAKPWSSFLPSSQSPFRRRSSRSTGTRGAVSYAKPRSRAPSTGESGTPSSWPGRCSRSVGWRADRRESRSSSSASSPGPETCGWSSSCICCWRCRQATQGKLTVAQGLPHADHPSQGPGADRTGSASRCGCPSARCRLWRGRRRRWSRSAGWCRPRGWC